MAVLLTVRRRRLDNTHAQSCFEAAAGSWEASSAYRCGYDVGSRRGGAFGIGGGRPMLLLAGLGSRIGSGGRCDRRIRIGGLGHS